MSDINEIVTHIENKLNRLSSTPPDLEYEPMYDTSEIVANLDNMLVDLPSMSSDRILLRVPNHLRRVKNEAYEPNIISIGPYHQGIDHLAAMEEHKFRYLKLLLHRRDDSSIERYVKALTKLNQKARNSYEKRFLGDRRYDGFLETMLVDGCFIVELIRKGVAENVSTEDAIFRSKMTLYLLKHNLLLLKNQLPFFILQELFYMTLLPNEESNLEDMIFRFFRILPGPGYKRGEEHNLPKVPVRHLLGLIHDNWLPSPKGVNTFLSMTEIKFPIDCDIITWGKEDDAKAHIQCATELNEAGIKFKRAEGEGIFDIKFANGVLEIPKLTIEDRTESLLKNLIAYEQFWKDDIYQVTDYVNFMDCLINSKKDVELLCRSGIMDNCLGDDDVVASMFNGLLDNARLYNARPFYSEIYLMVNKFCGSRNCNLWKAKLSGKWNVWKAKLRDDYFNGPWALISFLAAVILLLLTALQTVYSVLSYHHS